MVRALSIAVKLLLIALPVGSGLLLLLWSSLSQDTGVNVAATQFLLSEHASLISTLLVAVVAPLVACYLALWMAPGLIKSAKWQQVLSPLLSVPHVAFAVGLMLLLSPSGWLIRLVESISGLFPAPPHGWPLPEKSVITVIVILVLKELPFLLLMISAQLKQLPSKQWLIQAQSYGYSERQTWWRVLVPELLKRISLPMVAVIIYSLSVVDIPLLVGSNTQALLAQRVFEWSFQFSEASQAQALTGAWILMVLSLGLILLNKWHAPIYKKLISIKRVKSRKVSLNTDKVSRYAWALLATVSLGIVCVLLLQSLASNWFYPALWPDSLTFTRWQAEWEYLTEPTLNSVVLALVSALLGTISAVIILQRQRQSENNGLSWPILIGLSIPQVPLVLGWQLLLAGALNGGWQSVWVLWSHTVYTLPYAYLVLSGAYLSFDEQWLIKAQSLGYSARKSWWKIMLPMLKVPLAVAFAVAFSVSIAQYVPTQWLGQGLSPTLTTEAVSVASGGDWRIGSLYALLQMVLPLLVFISVGLLRTKNYAEHS